MKSFFISATLLICLHISAQNKISIFEVSPYQETEVVLSEGDAADDIAIYISHDGPNELVIIGTNKKYGLETYNSNGKRLFHAPFGRINNVDLLKGFKPSEKGALALLGGSNRTHLSLDFWHLNANDSITLQKRIKTELSDVYGFTFYSDSKATYAFVSDKKGTLLQYQLFFGGDHAFEVTLIRKLKFSSVVEGIEADPKRGLVLAAQENKGLWKFNAHPFLPLDKKLVLSVDRKDLKADLEGVALLERDQSRDLIFISVQGSNSYAILDAQDYLLKGIFKIVQGETTAIDGAEETDGIEVSWITQEEGLFIAQDGFNDGETQNFKFVKLSTILSQLDKI
jgi:3-phytase